MAGMSQIEFTSGFFQMLFNEPAILAATLAVAEKVEDAAIASAPVDTGAYKRGIGIVEAKSRGGRTVYRVTASDSKSLLVEAKTGNLQRAGRSVVR